MTLATSERHRLVVPFAYAAAGSLTHGYATTIHKAQGATVDRCFVLADETLTREHAYTALSRGRHTNELFVVHTERRTDERHATELEPEPLDVIRHAIGRTAGKTMAIDQLDPQIPMLEQLRRERDHIRARLGNGPPDPSHEYRQLCETINGQRDWRDNARWRLDTARRDLNDLGPIGCRTHRAERRVLDRRIIDFEHEVHRHDQQLAELEAGLVERAPAMRARSRWEGQHRTELDHLEALDRRINVSQQLDRVASRGLTQSIDGGVEIEP